MHRGSSKGAGTDLAPETLPLSALPLSTPASTGLLRVIVEVVRAGRTTVHEVDVPAGSPVRVAVRAAGHAPEGCAVLIGERPVPLDRPLTEPTRLTVVPTFSGG